MAQVHPMTEGYVCHLIGRAASASVSQPHRTGYGPDSLVYGRDILGLSVYLVWVEHMNSTSIRPWTD